MDQLCIKLYVLLTISMAELLALEKGSNLFHPPGFRCVIDQMHYLPFFHNVRAPIVSAEDDRSAKDGTMGI